MTDQNWAPARIWLQREQGEHGSHTWCEDSVGDGDIIEEAEYVRVEAAPPPASTNRLTDTVLEKLYWTAMDNASDILRYMDEARSIIAATEAK